MSIESINAEIAALRGMIRDAIANEGDECAEPNRVEALLEEINAAVDDLMIVDPDADAGHYSREVFAPRKHRR